MKQRTYLFDHFLFIQDENYEVDEIEDNYTGRMIVIAIQFLRRLCFSVAGIENPEYEYGIPCKLNTLKKMHFESYSKPNMAEYGRKIPVA